MARNTIFISYSHQDKKWKDKLLSYLQAMGDDWKPEIWVDTQIQFGDAWFENIQKAMKSARMALLLISVDFLNSDFIKREEIPALMRGQRERGLRIIPIILRECPWKLKKWIEEKQALPSEGKPIEEFAAHLQARALTEIAQKIWDLFQKEEIQQRDIEEIDPSLVLPTPAQISARTALENARNQKKDIFPHLLKKPIDYLDVIRCDLTKQVPSFLQNISPLGFHAFSHCGDYSMIEQYIVERLVWELKNVYRREVQAIKIYMKPLAFVGEPQTALTKALIQNHGGCQLQEIFGEQDTDYFLLIEAQSVPPHELREGAPQAWEALCQEVQVSLQKRRSRIIGLWINSAGIVLDPFCVIPALDKFDPEDVVVYFRGVLRDCGVPEEEREILLQELREHDGCLPATYRIMEKMVKDLAQGALT